MRSYCPGTLHWLLPKPELKAWLEDPNSANVLWMHGLPGVGKTMMSAYIISKLIAQGQKRCLLYFFCKRNSRRMTNAEHVLRTFSYQLSLQIPEFYAQLQDSLSESQVDFHSLSVPFLYNRLLGQPLSAIPGIITKEIYCIIDGLDQANFESKDDASQNPEIVDLLNLLVQPINAIRFRLLILSCNCNEVAAAVSRLNCVPMQICRKHNSADILRYVELEIEKNRELRVTLQKTKYDAKYLRDLAAGNFLWIRIVLSLIPSRYGTSEFEIALHAIPDEKFVQLYRQILTKVDSGKSLEDKQKLIKLIRVIASLAREMRVEELRIAVDPMSPTVEDFQHWLQKHCGLFIQVDDNPGPKYVRLIHQSFVTFITQLDEPHAEIGKYHIGLTEAHARFTSLLLRYLLEIKTFPLMKGKFIPRTEQNATKVFNELPLLKYAADRWSYHLRDSDSPDLMEDLSKLFKSRHILVWLEALGIFGMASSLPKITRNLRSWAEKLSKIPQISTQVYLWVRDLDRLYADFGEIISNRPNSVYYLLFDIFPSPSLFDNFRSPKGCEQASLSHHLSQSWNPVTVQMKYYTEYHISVVSAEQSIFAMAGVSEIRVLNQTSGATLRLFQPPDRCIWAVFAMAFNKFSARFASVHVIMRQELKTESPYAPELWVWDLNTSRRLAAVRLECSAHWGGDLFSGQDRILPNWRRGQGRGLEIQHRYGNK